MLQLESTFAKKKLISKKRMIFNNRNDAQMKKRTKNSKKKVDLSNKHK